MTRPDALIVPPLGGKRVFASSDPSRDLARALANMSRERDDAESREIAMHRLTVAVLTQAFGGEVYVDASLINDPIETIRTEYDARTGMTRIWTVPNHPEGSTT